MDPTLLLLVVAFGIFIVFQVISGRKRRRETTERTSRFVPGVEIMTNYGLYGTILEIDEETNVVTLESTPGTVLRVHRQTLLKVADYAPAADPTDADDTEAIAAVPADEAPAADTAPPAFGERIEDVPADRPLDGPDADGPLRTDGTDDLRSRRPGGPLDGA